MTRLVIIGYGMAGARLAAELRARDREGRLAITILGAEPHRAYNRILLSSLLAGRTAEADLTLAGPTGERVDVRLGAAATGIDRAARTVTTVDGSSTGYDALVLATGSRAIVPPVAGLCADRMPDRVAVFRTLDDCRRILTAAADARSALVLGGGLLGLEAARGLAARGLRVDVVHAVGHLMERQLDSAAGAVLATTLAGLGMTTHLGAAATAVEVGDSGVALRLADARQLAADLLVVACGVRPEAALAEAAGLTVKRGVAVDDQLRTSDPDIYAIGDCAEFPGAISGLVAPAWDQARVVADVISGTDPDSRYRPTPPVTRLKAAGIDLAAMGESVDQACSGTAERRDSVVTYSDPTLGLYAKLVIREERLAGAILLGDHACVGTVIQLFDRQTPLPPDRRQLLLGRSGSVPSGQGTAESPALVPDGAVICRCNNVTKGAITKAWLAGSDVADATQATTGCGTCRDAIDGILSWLSTTDGAPRRKEAVAA